MNALARIPVRVSSTGSDSGFAKASVKVITEARAGAFAEALAEVFAEAPDRELADASDDGPSDTLLQNGSSASPAAPCPALGSVLPHF